MCLTLKQKIHEERLNMFILKPLLVTLLWILTIMLWNDLLTSKKVISIDNTNPSLVHSAQAQTAGDEVRTISDEQAPKSALSEETNNPNQEESRKISTPADIKMLIKKYFPIEAQKIAIAVAKGESGLNSQTIGDKHLTYWKNGKMYGDSIGVFQIRTFPNRPDREKLKDPEFNIKYAASMYEKQGFYPWTVYKTGQYERYLTD